jgi:hypothetical protein
MNNYSDLKVEKKKPDPEERNTDIPLKNNWILFHVRKKSYSRKKKVK